jgi:peptidoglycan/xylan/chitin deacetylase (PgdA/CDA1 family)
MPSRQSIWMTRQLGVILLYHRVADLRSDPQEVAVGAANFAAQMDVIREAARVVPLREAGTLDEAHVAITFDDGYRDNAQTAAPMLNAAGIPATFFVTSGFLGAAEAPWWTELESLCLSRELAEPVQIEVSGTKLWVDARNRAALRRLYWALYWRLRPLPPAHIHEVMKDLTTTLGPPSAPPPEDLFMSSGELERLAAEELFEVGSHTVNHPFLGSQTSESQARELTDSRRMLEELIENPVVSLSYPYGGPDSFNDQTVALARAAGYQRACIVRNGRVGPDTDPMRIPRCVVKDWSGEEFAPQLFRWLGD